MTRRGGWRRTGRRRFGYVDAKGRRITDEADLERVKSLAIPPAWEEVWISPNPRADLQATGTDAAGRRQYIYHPAFRAQREQEKFAGLIRFGESLPVLREAIAKHASSKALTHDWVCATAVTLINRGWFRVGSEQHARRSRTYGITTLTKGHVQRIRGKSVTFRFRAKHRVLVRSTVVDEELASAISTLKKAPGGARLFRYENGEGFVNLSAPTLNAYLGEHASEHITSKDFRTWGGTLTAAVALAEHGPPGSEVEAKRAVAAAMRRVAAELANTPAVARSSYVSPAVVEQFLAGRTLDDFRPHRLRVASRLAAGLAPEEAALLSLLRSWRIRSARPEARAA